MFINNQAAGLWDVQTSKVQNQSISPHRKTKSKGAKTASKPENTRGKKYESTGKQEARRKTQHTGKDKGEQMDLNTTVRVGQTITVEETEQGEEV